jgi:hypothetical protein
MSTTPERANRLNQLGQTFIGEHLWRRQAAAIGPIFRQRHSVRSRDAFAHVEPPVSPAPLKQNSQPAPGKWMKWMGYNNRIRIGIGRPRTMR